MSTHQSAVSFASELLALIEWNSFEIEVSLLDEDVLEVKRTLSDDARKALQIEQAVVAECFSQKQYPWAIDAQKNVLKIFEENLGMLDLETLECLRDLGNLYNWDKKFEEAKKCYLRAWRIAHSVLPRKHAFLQSVTAMYQECLGEIEKSQHVVSLHHHMAQIITASQGAQEEAGGILDIQSLTDLDTALDQAQVYLAQAKYEQAESLLRMGVKYLGRRTEPKLRSRLKEVFALWADALGGVGLVHAADKTRLLTQKL